MKLKRNRKLGPRVEFTCPVCANTLALTPGDAAKRKFCSPLCAARDPLQRAKTSARSRGNGYSLKSDKPGRWAMHKRANAAKPPGPCERCAGPGQIVHHKDENPWNNDLSNLERLCRPCHINHHRATLQKAKVAA